MSLWGHSRPKWSVRAMSGLPPLATELRTSLVVRFVPNPDTTRYGYHHLTGQTSLLLAPRATRLCQANA